MLTYVGELAVRLTLLNSFGPQEVLYCYSFSALILYPILLYAIPGAVIGALFAVLGKEGSPWKPFPSFIAFNLALIFLFYASLWVHLSLLGGIGLLDSRSVGSTFLLLLIALLLFRLSRRNRFLRLTPGLSISVCSVSVVFISLLCFLLPAREMGRKLSEVREDGRDILIITLDTVRRDALGCYGNQVFNTPTLDSLAERGVVYAEAVSQSPYTAPSHASLLTSLYPSSHSVRTNGMLLKESTQTLASLLSSHDYSCAAILSGTSLSHDVCGLNKGFVIYDDVFTPLEGFMRTSMGECAWRFFKKTAPGTFAHLYRKLQEKKAHKTTDTAIHWLSRINGKAFLWVHYFDPHFTYKPPPPYETMYDPDFQGEFRPYRHLANLSAVFKNSIEITEKEKQHAWALYGGEISYLDRELGRLLAEIDIMGRLEDMLVIVVADHGEYFGEYGQYFMHGGLKEEVIKVPLIVVDPSGELEGAGNDSPVEIVDIMPTILQIIMLSPPPGLQGESILEDAGAGNFAFTDCGPCGKVSVRGSGSMLVLDLNSGEQELSWLGEGSGEIPVEDVRDLETAMEAWRKQVGLVEGFQLEPDESERLKSLGYIH
jgi:arylsulfatase A-like enzyme